MVVLLEGRGMHPENKKKIRIHILDAFPPLTPWDPNNKINLYGTPNNIMNNKQCLSFPIVLGVPRRDERNEYCKSNKS